MLLMRNSRRVIFVACCALIAPAFAGLIVVSGSSRYVAAGGGGSAPAYTPLELANFDTGSNGDSPLASDGLSGTPFDATTKSNDIAGPLGGSLVLRSELTARNDHFFAGELWNGSVTVVDNDEMWIRVWEYYPTGFSFSCGDNNNNDCWGGFKWFRITLGGQRGTWQVSNNETWGLTDEFGSASNLQFNASQVASLPRDTWVCREYYVRFNGDSTGIIRYWQDGVYQTETTGNTKPSGSVTLSELVIGDYWNGGAPAQQHYYSDEYIVTMEEPDEVDGSGRPMIGCDRQVSDFS